MKKEQQIRIVRESSAKYLGFQIIFNPGDDAGDSISLPYDAFRHLMWLGKEFISSCTCTEIIHRWEADDYDQ